MQAFLKTQLESFDSLAAHYQDDAYTFAYYLLGDESRAIEATGAAFARVSRHRQRRPAAFREEVLRLVLENCRSGRIPVSGLREDGDLAAALQRLDLPERSAVVLVDVLGCAYEEAAGVLSCSTRQVARLLARGRLGFRQGGLAM